MDEENKIDFDVNEVNAGMVARGGQLIIEGKYEDGIKLINSGTDNLVKVAKATQDDEAKAKQERKETAELIIKGVAAGAPIVGAGLVLMGIVTKEVFSAIMFDKFCAHEDEGIAFVGSTAKFLIDKIKDAIR